ncbi:MAG TPA: hypothetical protein VMI75_32235 [Polyangiaceae bacterium]|nr:hypothetical protein [Polyangiaceae bacterium]
MNALAYRYAAPTGELQVPHTVATLDARVMVAELRRLLAYDGDLRIVRDQLRDQADTLTDQIADLLHDCDGMVSGELYASAEKDRDDANESSEEADREARDAEEERDDLQRQLDELEEAAQEEPDALLSKYTALMVAKVEAADKRMAAIDRAFRNAKRAAARSKVAIEALNACEREIREATNK